MGVALSVCAALAPPSSAQRAAPVSGVAQLIGLTGIQQHATGSLSIDHGNLQFLNIKAKANVAVASIQDIVTGNDSQHLIRRTLRVLTTFAPYASGRFVSLFRMKLDNLTFQYVD